MKASRLECLLVAQTPREFMIGSVPFDFKDRAAHEKAMKQFKDQTVWMLKKPSFDQKAKAEYNRCPLQNTVLLISRSQLLPVTSSNTMELQATATNIEVPRNLTELLGLLASMPFDTSTARSPHSGSAKQISKVLNVCGKKVNLTSQRFVQKGSNHISVAESTLSDTLVVLF